MLTEDSITRVALDVADVVAVVLADVLAVVEADVEAVLVTLVVPVDDMEVLAEVLTVVV